MRRVSTSLVLALALRRAQAQSPTGVVSGTVRDPNGAALANAEVTLVGEAIGARTDPDGRFVLREVAPGPHVALVRRIGYATIERRFVARVNADVRIDVAMTPLPRALERVVVEAPGMTRRRGASSITGTVQDSAGRAVADADVRLLGAGLSTITDSTGRFHFPSLAAGSYVVRVRHHGSSPGSYVIQLADDDARGTTMRLYGLPRGIRGRDTTSASGYGAADAPFDAFDRRRRNGERGIVLGPAELFRADRRSLDDLLQPYREPRRRGTVSSIDDDDCLLIDGRRPVEQPLAAYTSTDVQLIEVFPPRAVTDDYIQMQMSGLPHCKGDRDRHPPYFILWTRALR